MDHLLKFHLNQTVNESGNAVLRKLRKLEKRCRLALRNLEPSVCGTKPMPGGSCSAKIRKTTFFMNQNTTRIFGMAPSGQLGAARQLLLFQEPINPLHLRTSTSLHYPGFIQFTTQKAVLTCLGSRSIPKTSNK